MKFYRLTYNGMGLYEALKKIIWKKSNNPKEDWCNFKNSPNTNWLPIPPIYADEQSKYCSYFTETGYARFKSLTLPLIYKWIDKEKIDLYEVNMDTGNNIVYKDEFQIVVKE